MSEQQNIFEMLSPEFKFPKNHTITLFEAFAGIGCQRLALKRITNNYVSLGISEIDKPALKSYEAIHNDMKNYGSICDIHELPKGIDIFTYSFPCTDLSKAGKQKGLNEQTRSGLIYEVLRVLQENKHNLPKVLIMENVVDLVQTKFIKQFNEIQLEIEKLGYCNNVFIMNAKNYGIPQNRERVFMVSILGDYYYKPPTPFPLKLKLKDLLESEVDEKYYLSQKMMSYITSEDDAYKVNENNLIVNRSIGCTKSTREGNTRADASDYVCSDLPDDVNIKTIMLSQQGKHIEKETDIAGTLMARDYKGFGNQPMNAVVEVNRLFGIFGNHQAGGVYDKEGLSPTLGTMQGGYRQPMIVEDEGNQLNIDKDKISKHLTETLEQNEGNIFENSYIDAYNRNVNNSGLSGVIHTRINASNDTYVVVKDSNYVGTYDYAQSNTLRPTEESRTHIGNECSGTIIASGNQNGIIVKDTIPIRNATQQGYLLAQDGDGIDISSRMETHRGTVQKGMSLTLKTTPDVGVCVKDDMKTKLCNSLIANGKVQEGDIVKHSYTQQILDGKKKAVEKNNGEMITLTTRADTIGIVVKDNLDETLYTPMEAKLFTEEGNIKRYINSDIVDEFKEGQMATTSYPNGYDHGPRTHNESICLNLIDKPSVKQNLRIRKLTPREAWRLMGIYDQDFNKAKAVNSDSQLYKQAGNGIVVDVFYYILKGLIDEQ